MKNPPLLSIRQELALTEKLLGLVRDCSPLPYGDAFHQNPLVLALAKRFGVTTIYLRSRCTRIERRIR